MLGKMAGAFALLFLSTAATHASDVYKLDLSVTRNGSAVGKATVQVIGDRNADLVMAPASGSNEDAVRIVVSVSATAERDMVGIHMKVFDQTDGKWTLRSEPSLKAKLNNEISLTIGNSAGTSPATPPIELGLKVDSSRGPAA